MGSVIGYQEAHGPVATFETDVARKIKNLVVDINPVQSGSGDPSPENIRPITGWTGAKVTKCGKNLLDDKKYQYTATQVRIGTDGSSDYNYIPRGIYTLSVTASVNTTVYYRIEGADVIRIGMNGGTFELEQDLLVCFYCYKSGSLSVDDITQWQLELGSTATEYEPYVGSTYDITFPSEAGTVYGGTLDVVKGTLTVDKAIVSANTSTMNNSQNYPGWSDMFDIGEIVGYGVNRRYNGITNIGTHFGVNTTYNSSKAKYNDVIHLAKDHYGMTQDEWIALNLDVQIIVPLATPIVHQLTQQEISTIIGTNTIYADTGDTLVIYPKTITPVETVSNVNLMELRRSIMMAMQHNYIPEITTYGVEWHYSDPSTILTRTGNAANFSNPIPAESLSSTGSSPFDNIYPWSEMKRYNIINGEVAYSQDDAGYSETDYDTVVYIPTFYYKAQKDTTNEKWNWSISGKPADGYEKHPGSGRYVGRFHTSGSSSGVFSKGGVAPLGNVTRANFRTYSNNKGDNWWQMDLATWSAIQLLYLVEFANWHSQDTLGKGQNSGSVKNTGATTGAAYHTLKQTGAGGNMYRWIENPFSNVYTWVDGYVASSKASYVTTDPASYGDTTTGMEAAGITLPSSGWISSLGYSEKCAWAFIPDAASGGSATTKVPDYVYSDTGVKVLYIGGDWSAYDGYGAFCFYAIGSATDNSKNFGSRLIYIPTT